MQRYELTDGTSSKFWEAGVTGSTLTVRFGRIGAAGQSKDKAFGSAAAAAAELAKLVKEKTGKGYALAGTAAAPPLPAPVAAPASSPVVAPGVAEVSAPAAVATSVLPVPADGERGRLLTAAPLPTRTRPAAPVPRDEAWAELGRLVRAARVGDGEAGEASAWLRAQVDAPQPTAVTVEDARLWRNTLYRARVVDGAPFYDSARSPSRVLVRATVMALAWWLAGHGGAVFLVRLADRLRPPVDRNARSDLGGWADPFEVAMRHALSAAPDAEYDEAAAWCEAVCRAEPDWHLAAFFAFILADDRPEPHPLQPLPVLREAERQGVDVAATRMTIPLQADLPPSVNAPWRTEMVHEFYFYPSELDGAQVAATLTAVARAHGDRVFPSLCWLFPEAKEEDRTALAAAMLDTQDDDALPFLLAFGHEKPIQAALNRAEAAYPAWMLQQYVLALSAGRADPAMRARVLRMLDAHGEGAVRSWAGGLPARAARHLDGLLATRDVPLAPPDAWPAVLREPPWRVKGRTAEPDIVLDLWPVSTPFAYPPGANPVKARYTYRTNQAWLVPDMAALAETLQRAESYKGPSWRSPSPPAEPPPARDAPLQEVQAWLARRLTELSRLRFGIYGTNYMHLYDGLENQPAPLALALWELTGPLLASGIHWSDAAPLFLQRFGDAAMPGLVRLLQQDPLTLFPYALAVDTPDIAPVAAHALLRLKTVRPLAVTWLRAHRRTALMRLLPDAVGTPGEARDAAEHVLRWFATNTRDGPVAVSEATAAYLHADARVTAAVAQVMGRDPLLRVPAKVARLPAWANPALLARPVLKDGGALPEPAVAALLEMLSFSTPENRYAGIPLVRDACTPGSRAAFAWDLFSAWLAAGAPAKDGWAMRAVGWLGDDECARQLTRLIRRWPGEAAHARAVTGLDVLADIGTDVALMNLNGIAEKVKFKGLQERARDRIATLAEARDLTPEELADRLAPDLDLDERGGLDLDFGPRRFRVGFDEFLKPAVRDEAGARLKDLPKPAKADDAGKAADAVARWSAVKKDARAVASQQLVRLEAMLATARRVRPAVFWPFFAAHPLIRHLAQRLVWGVYPDTAPMTAPTLLFRVAEDGTCTDAEDDPVALDVSDAAEGLVGLVHPFQAPDALAAWGTLFGDYEIAQPFPQLGRDTYALTEAERGASETSRFEGVRVESSRVRGMAAGGWPLGGPQDGGVIHWMERPLVFSDGRTGQALQYFEDGLQTGGGDWESKVQTLKTLQLYTRWAASGSDTFRFGELDPLTASEMLRGLHRLAATAVP